MTRPALQQPRSRREARRQEQVRALRRRTRARVLRARLAGALAVVVSGVAMGSALTTAQADGVSAGRFTLTPGTSVSADSGVRYSDGLAAVAVTLDRLPTGGGVYVALHLRSVGPGTGYRAKLRVLPDGSLRLGGSRVSGNVETSLGSLPLTGLVAAPGRPVTLQAAITGTGTATDPVRLSARARPAGTRAPQAWQFTVTDAGPGALTGAGSARFWSYLSAGSTTVSGRYSGLSALAGPGRPSTAIPTATLAPVATGAPTAGPTATPTARPPDGPTPSATSTTRPRPPSMGRPVAAPDDAPQLPPAGRPGPQNTGVPPGVPLTVHRGDLVITRDGATYDRLDVRGFVEVRAANVTITRSIVRGGIATGNRGLVTVTHPAARNFVIEDSELVPDHPSVWLDGLKGSNFTARRINAHGGVDAVKIHGDDARVYDSYLHGNRFYPDDPNQGGGPTHNDGVQVLGGRGIVISGNTISGGPASGIQVTQDHAAVTGLMITDNWVSGGVCNLQLNHKRLSAMATVVVEGNRFGGGTRDNCVILRTGATSVQASGNSTDGSPAEARVAVHG